MLRLEDYFNDQAVEYVKNHNSEVVRGLYDNFVNFGGVGDARSLGWSLLRNGPTKEDTVNGLGWLLKAVDMYENKEYKVGEFFNPEMEEREYVSALGGIGLIFLPELDRVEDLLRRYARNFIEPDADTALEYLLKAASFDCCDCGTALELSVAYFEGVFGNPDYDKALYYLGVAIVRGETNLNFLATYLQEIKEQKREVRGKTETQKTSRGERSMRVNEFDLPEEGFALIAGRPAVGKTHMAVHMLESLTEGGTKATMLFVGGMESHETLQYMDGEEHVIPSELDEIKKDHPDLPYIVDDNAYVLSPYGWKELLTDILVHVNPKVLFISNLVMPWEKLTADIAAFFNRFAKEKHILIVAEINVSKAVEKRRDKCPKVKDVKCTLRARKFVDQFIFVR